ncbi:MAG: hypothetical protein MJ010_05930 [Paludibacteraceae bacterium]|nr:hypothetical protein [Paludibacteraceae bacterium]
MGIKNLFGILCLDVKCDPEYVLERLEVRSESHNISGWFSVNPSKFTTGGCESKCLMVDCRRGVSLPKSGTKIYEVFGSFGDYWCSTPDGERIAFYMSFNYDDYQGYYQGINNF